MIPWSRCGAEGCSNGLMPRRLPPARVRDFVPLHCPHRECPAHTIGPGETYSFHRRGYQRTERAPGWSRIFQCRHCGRYFRDACFGPDYWKKRGGLWRRVFLGLANGQAKRQLARCLGVSRRTVDRIERDLAKHCLLLHVRQLRRLEGQIDEPVVLDGFRTFAGSQYEPLDLNTTATCESGFLLHIGAAPLRRSGTMTPRQKVVREQRDRRLGRPARGLRRALTRRALRLLERLRAPGHRLELRSDEEPDYARALSDLQGAVSIRHVRVSSKARRDERNPLWRINLLHLLMRHSLKSHTRETIAPHKCLRGLMDRALILMSWLNNVKGISERSAKKSRTTPAMLLGLAEAPLDLEDFFSRRLFPVREKLPASLKQLYEGRIKARPREHLAVLTPVFRY